MYTKDGLFTFHSISQSVDSYISLFIDLLSVLHQRRYYRNDQYLYILVVSCTLPGCRPPHGLVLSLSLNLSCNIPDCGPLLPHVFVFVFVFLFVFVFEFVLQHTWLWAPPPPCICICLCIWICLATYLTVGPPMGQLPLQIFWIWDFCFHLRRHAACIMMGPHSLSWSNSDKIRLKDIFFEVFTRSKLIMLMFWKEIQNIYWWSFNVLDSLLDGLEEK